MLKFGGGKVLKLSKLMGALILEGVLQDALDAQDVLEAPTGPAFSIEELEWGRGRRFSFLG